MFSTYQLKCNPFSGNTEKLDEIREIEIGGLCPGESEILPSVLHPTSWMKTAENGSSLCMGNYLSSYTFISLALLLNANTNESFKKKLLPNRWWYALYTYPICCRSSWDKSMANVFLDKIGAKKEYKITFSLVFLFSIPISMS